ncbi:MAG: MBL fold metallo-hydrolase [Firmicutes bacterium]|nr:MBL fold metallo-hydrolase [Bacillota bacterium]
MKLIVLASGSKGNATYIETENAKILIDAGLSLSDLEARMRLVGINPHELSGVLVTHEHIDHIKSVGALSRKYGIDVYAHEDVWEHIIRRSGFVGVKNQKIISERGFYINDLDVSPFEVPHDSVHCFGFSLFNNNNKISLATDIGQADDRTLKAMSRSDLIVLESNHDPHMLSCTKRPEQIKTRILSSRGHLSNAACAETLKQLLNQNVRGVILAHISEEANTPELAYQSAVAALESVGAGRDVHIGIAPQRHVGNVYKLKNR